MLTWHLTSHVHSGRLNSEVARIQLNVYTQTCNTHALTFISSALTHTVYSDVCGFWWRVAKEIDCFCDVLPEHQHSNYNTHARTLLHTDTHTPLSAKCFFEAIQSSFSSLSVLFTCPCCALCAPIAQCHQPLQKIPLTSCTASICSVREGHISRK